MSRFALLTALLPVLLCGCSDNDLGSPAPNQPPETVLSNAPMQGGTSPAEVRLDWDGTDADGEVVAFRFAWDDSTEWFSTTSAGSSFVVAVDTCNYEGPDSTLWAGQHTFWVRAVDNRGAEDPTPAYRTFTAESTAPITTITLGPCGSGYCGTLSWNPLFRWTAFDPDGGEVDSFFYKLNTTRALQDRVDSSWTRVGADCTYVHFVDVERTFPITGRYNSFAVVAKDRSGALERILVHGQNWCCFDPLGGCGPYIYVNGGILGRRSNVSSWSNPVGESFYGMPISFSWSAEASWCGLSVALTRYALDDTVRWSEWSADVRRYPEDGSTFLPTPGNHVFYVEAVDNWEQVGLCAFKYYIEIGPTIGETYPILLVDDSRYSGFPQSHRSWHPEDADRVEGEFFERVLAGYGYTEFDCRAQGREPPPISLVGRFRTVLWYYDDNNGIGGELRRIFLLGTRFLDSYVGAGGNLILMGQQPALALDPDCRPSYAYPFLYDESYCPEGRVPPVSLTRFGIRELHIVTDAQFHGAISCREGYPSLPLGEMWPFFTETDTAGLWDVEAFDPDGVNPNVNAIPIYDFGCGGWSEEVAEIICPWQHCALVVDNSGGLPAGSTAYFGWPLIWCDWDSVAVMMRKVLTDVCDEPPAY